MNRIPTWVHYALCLVILAFAMLGATNAVHTSAKIVYSIVNVACGAWLVSTVRRRPVEAH